MKNIINDNLNEKKLNYDDMPQLIIIDGLCETNKMLLLEKVLNNLPSIDFIIYTSTCCKLKKRQKWINLKKLSWSEERKLLLQDLNNRSNIIYVTKEASNDLSIFQNKAKELNYLVKQYISLTNDLEYIITNYEKYINNKNSKLLDWSEICHSFHKRLHNYLENKENCLFFEKDKRIEANNCYEVIKKQIKKINQLDLDIRIKNILLNLSGYEKTKFKTICKNVIYAQLFLANNDNLKIYQGKAVVLMLCSSCNIKRCRHCYISYKGDFLVNEALDVVKKLKDKYTVLLNGAEVLVNDKYLNVYKFLNQKWLLTNGIKLLKDSKTVDKLKESGIDTIEMSYHFGIQEDISDISEGQLLKIIDLVKKAGFKIKLLTTITLKNYDKIRNICDKAIEYNVDAIQFTNLINTGKAKSLEENLALTTQEKKVFFELLNKAREEISKNKLIIERSGTFGFDENHKTNFNCPAYNDLVVITPDYKVYPCIFLTSPGNEIGRYIDGKIYIKENNEYKDKKICFVQRKYNGGGE